MENLDHSLDLLVDNILEFDEIAFLDIVQSIWRRGWPLESASKPQDQSPLRQALKACLIERMVEIWNAPPKNSNEKAPDWCDKIPPIKDCFSVIKSEHQSFYKNEPENPTFAKRNIFAPMEFMFFL